MHLRGWRSLVANDNPTGPVLPRTPLLLSARSAEEGVNHLKLIGRMTVALPTRSSAVVSAPAQTPKGTEIEVVHVLQKLH